MYSRALRIALTKAETPALRSRLADMLPIAEHLDETEGTFEARINANKAARGEKPTRMSKPERKQLNEYATDAGDMQAEQLASFEASLTSREIAATLRAGLAGDLQFWRSADKYAHSADRPLIEDFVNVKARMLDALTRFLMDTPVTMPNG